VPIKEKGWLIIGLRESDSIIAADELRGLDVRVIGEQHASVPRKAAPHRRVPSYYEFATHTISARPLRTSSHA
jgi:hypothetical protein